MSAEKNEKIVSDYLKVQNLESINDFPLYLQVETIAKCNARCAMCGHSAHTIKRNAYIMPQDLRTRILSQIREHATSIRRTIPQLFGEPLLDKNLFSFIHSIRSFGINEIFITTNGSLLNTENIKKILDCGLTNLDISLSALMEQTYNNIHCGLDFKTVIRNIENFIELRDKHNVHLPLRLRFVLQQSNMHEYKEYLNFWKQRFAPTDGFSIRKLHIFDHMNQGRVEIPEDFNKIDTPCHLPFGSLVITTDGQVSLCCVDENADFPLGNAWDQTIQEIWKSQKFNEIRRIHLKKGFSAHAPCRSLCSASQLHEKYADPGAVKVML